MPILTDGKPHNISLDVVSAETDHAINQNWFVSGNLQVITDPSPKPTVGKITVFDVQPFATTTTTGTIAANNDTVFTVTASRKVHIESEFVSGSGKTTHVVWTQTLDYSNTQSYLNNSNIQVSVAVLVKVPSESSSEHLFHLLQLLKQTATGTFTSTNNGVTTLTDQFSFPLNANLTSLTPNGSSCGWLSFVFC